MPLCEYGCLECRARETRVAGLDDHAAVCVVCGGVMLRTTEGLFQAYFVSMPGDFRAGASRPSKNDCG
jgi:predicted nucleic acid-binding Zn ribbon protein